MKRWRIPDQRFRESRGSVFQAFNAQIMPKPNVMGPFPKPKALSGLA